MKEDVDAVMEQVCTICWWAFECKDKESLKVRCALCTIHKQIQQAIDRAEAETAKEMKDLFLNNRKGDVQ